MKSEQTKWDGGPWLKKGLGQGAEELGVGLIFRAPGDGTGKVPSREARGGSEKSEMTGKSSYNQITELEVER